MNIREVEFYTFPLGLSTMIQKKTKKKRIIDQQFKKPLKHRSLPRSTRHKINATTQIYQMCTKLRLV